jgi:hypothetical protein
MGSALGSVVAARYAAIISAAEADTVLPLSSARWSQLEAAGGNPRIVPRLIQELTDSPTPSDWDEVWEQVSQQWSGYSIAFAAIPYLVHLAIEQGIAATPEFLLGLGRTVDSLAPLGPCPSDLASDYDAALREVSPILEQSARSPRYTPEDYVCVLHAATALSGRSGLGTQLFHSLDAGGPELDCPKCGAYLSGEFEESGLVFQSVNSRFQPLSEKAWVRPAHWNRGVIEGDSPAEPFEWLADLCRTARQEEVLRKICLLYGMLVCPLCSTTISVMSEV